MHPNPRAPYKRGGGSRGSSPPPKWCRVFRGAKGTEEIFGLNELAKASEKSFDRPKARKKVWPTILKAGEVVVGWVQGGWLGVCVWGPSTPPLPPAVPSC